VSEVAPPARMRFWLPLMGVDVDLGSPSSQILQEGHEVPQLLDGMKRSKSLRHERPIERAKRLHVVAAQFNFLAIE